MNEEKFNMELRKFLKKVGITSQREIEKAVRAALESGAIAGHETIAVRATVEIPALGVTEKIDGTIALD